MYLWESMGTFPNEQLELTLFQEKIIEIVKEHPGSNQTQIRKLLGQSNKNTLSKHLIFLCENNQIEYTELRQGDKSYFPKIDFFSTLQDLEKNSLEDFERRKQLISKCLEKVEKKDPKIIVFVYVNSIKAIFSFLNVVKFSLAANPLKEPKHWLYLEKELEELLKMVTKRIPNYAYVEVLRELSKLDMDILENLEYFLTSTKKIDKQIRSKNSTLH